MELVSKDVFLGLVQTKNARFTTRSALSPAAEFSYAVTYTIVLKCLFWSLVCMHHFHDVATAGKDASLYGRRGDF